jgi:hypothetical protein
VTNLAVLDEIEYLEELLRRRGRRKAVSSLRHRYIVGAISERERVRPPLGRDGSTGEAAARGKQTVQKQTPIVF